MRKFLEVLFGLLLGVLTGWSTASYLGMTNLDSGFATLIGSAFGAGISVAGAMWVAIYQGAAHARAAELYAGDATASLRDEAHCLARMARSQDNETLELRAAKLTELIDLFGENVKLWKSGMPYRDVNNYGARLRLSKVEQKIIEKLGQVRRDRSFLTGNVSQAVMDNAVFHLSAIGEDIEHVCEDAMVALTYVKARPTDSEFYARVMAVQEEDRIEQRHKQADWLQSG